MSAVPTLAFLEAADLWGSLCNAELLVVRGPQRMVGGMPGGGGCSECLKKIPEALT